MSNIETYLPLYRKYRPQSFADVMGQAAIRQTLTNAITQGKVAHAYLFCGPRGTGKTSTARIFAKSLNCENGPEGLSTGKTPCQVCASCVGITQGNALDVIEFDAASNNKVDDARELIENCQFTAMAGKYKIYIIDEVHMLTSQAFNALLKTLEEPPPNVVFIFATTEAHKVLPTIVSRCQRFDFSRITRQDIVRRLGDIASQENIRIDQEALDTIARHVRGGMRDAVGLLDQVAVIGRAQPDKVINREDVTQFIGALEEDILIWMGQAIADKQADVLLQQIGELEKRGIEPPQLVKDLTTHYRHLFFVASAQKSSRNDLSASALDLPEAYYQKLCEQAQGYRLEELPQILNRLSGIERNIRHTQQPQLWLEVGLLELAHRQDIHVVEQLAKRLEDLEKSLENALQLGLQASNPANNRMLPPKAIQRQQSPQASGPPTDTLTSENANATPKPTPASMPDLSRQPETETVGPAHQEASPLASGDLYQQICQQVQSPMTKTLLLQQTSMISFDGETLTIGCSSDQNLENLKKPVKFIHLEKAAEQVLGKKPRITLVLGKVEAPTSASPEGFALPKA